MTVKPCNPALVELISKFSSLKVCCMAFSHSSAPRTAPATRKASSKAGRQHPLVPSCELASQPVVGTAREKHGRLIPVPAWPEHHAWPPIGGLRHLIFYASTNGFDQVIRRVGRRVLIDEDAFFA